VVVALAGHYAHTGDLQRERSVLEAWLRFCSFHRRATPSVIPGLLGRAQALGVAPSAWAACGPAVSGEGG
jgi:hypothetical protein